MAKIAFIGLGHMGGGMAPNLVKGGHEVRAFDLVSEAVKQSGRTDVKVTGLSLPNMCKPYVHDGVIESIVLWNTLDLGYLTVYASSALSGGQLKRGDQNVAAGRLGRIEIQNDEVRLGAPFIFNKTNIDGFNF